MASSQIHPPIEIRLLGSFELVVRGVSVGSVPKAVQALLALITASKGKPSRPTIAAALWPDASPERAGFYLRRTLTQLRTLLGPERERLGADLTFDLTDCRCDLVEFMAASKSRPEAAEQLYRGAPLFWKGVLPLESLAFEIQEAYIGILSTLARNKEEEGQTGQAIDALRRLIAADPSRESAWRDLMRLLARNGDHAGLSRAFRQLRTRLLSEVGLEPEQETTELYHRLMCEADVLRIRPSSAVPRPVATRLPTPLTSMIGRDKDRARLRSMLHVSRLVAIVGLGGIGKTRLAIDLIENHPKGIAVDGSSWKSEEEAIGALANALGALEPDLSGIKNVVGGNDFLLVIDRTENVLDLSERVIRALLEEIPSLRVVFTSRRRAEWSGARVLRLAPLPVPNENDSIATLAESDSVRLFLDRAIASDPDFNLSPRNAAAVASICRRLDGMPLAIELAAARVSSFSAAEIERRLSDRFTFLTKSTSSQALQTVMDWTYSVLAPQEAALFRQLSIFPLSWDREAAEMICPDYSSDRLEALVKVDLVIHEEGRYRMLETVRAYGARQSRVELDQAARFVGHFATIAQEFAGTSHEYDDAIIWFRREFESVSKSLVLATQFKDLELMRLGFKLLNCSYPLWHSVGRLRDLYGLGQSLVEVGEPSEELVSALFVLGSAAHLLFDYSSAEAHFNAAEKLASALGILSWQAESLRQRGELAASRGQVAQGYELIQQALSLFESTKNEVGQAQCLGYLGYLEREQGHLDAAMNFTQQSMAIHSRLNRVTDKLWCIGSLGAIFLEMKDGVRAARHFREALESCRPDSDVYIRIWNLTMLGQAELINGDLHGAASHVRESIALRDPTQEMGLEWPTSLLGEILMELGDYAAAKEALETALRINASTHILSLELYTLIRLSDLHFRTNDSETGFVYLTRAEERLKESEVEGPARHLAELKRRVTS